MPIAYQSVVEVLGERLALMTRRERGVWSLPNTNADILAIAKGRFKAPSCINHSLSRVGLSSRSLIGILAEGVVRRHLYKAVYAGVAHRPYLARSVSEGSVGSPPRLRFGLVSNS